MISREPLHGITTTIEAVQSIAGEGMESFVVLCQKSSVDRHHRARDVGTFITQQESYQFRDF